MMDNLRWRHEFRAVVLLMGACAAGVTAVDKYTLAAAERMIAAAEGTLAPVYAPLAEEIAARLDLADKEGIGIDLGSGPGTLIVELCRRTKLHWINGDINPHFFPYFMQKADAAGLGGRVSAVWADAQALPFRADYADVVVSRGSFHFWPDKVRAFGEIYRVLKPGSTAYIGRGLPGNMPLEEAREVRRKHGSGPKYDVDETERELRRIMNALGIADFTIRRPHAGNTAGVNYGIWLEFRKP
ncbi:MAG: class I SAM-dependent methyltransferase [Phycisphaerales bacterium]|nr:MAG: class I SAM-dependent methyltransferase [Phycisphaerales bacterium]